MSRPVGRPTLSSDNKRTRRINVPLSDNTHAALVRDSGKAGITKAAFIRQRLLEEVAQLEVISQPPQDLVDAFSQHTAILNDWSVYLHRQASAQGHKGVDPDHHAALTSLLQGLLRLAGDVTRSCQVTTHE